MKPKGKIFDIQRFSLHDGPGTRTVVFFKGCPLRCRWCHNPEGLESKTEIMFNKYKCIGCGECASRCVNERHKMNGDFHEYDRDGCSGCGKCAEVCCTEALRIAGKEMTVLQVMEEVMRDKIYYNNGGGITLSGGEPMLQSDFALLVLSEAKQQGITTCMETCGYAKDSDFLKILPFTDIFLFDYKVTGDELHKEMTGVSNRLILNNLNLLNINGCRIILRCPIITGINDNEEHIEAIAELANSLKNIEQIHFEPYHDMGRSKAEFSGRQNDFCPTVPEKEKMDELLGILQKMTDTKAVIS